MPKYLLFVLFLCLHWSAWGQVKYDYSYWFDNNASQRFDATATSENWQFDADISGLSYSFHSLHIQVKDTAGIWSVPVTRYFVKMPDRNMMNAFYWFDNDDRTRQQSAFISGKFGVDVSQLTENVHTFHYQLNDVDGNASAPRTTYFFKTLMPNDESLRYRYWVDNDMSTFKEEKYTKGPLIVDVVGMDDGFHVLHLQVENNRSASIPHSRMFIKIPQTEAVGFLNCVCSIDGKLYKYEKVASEGGVVNWTLDVSSLSQGLHRMQVQTITPSGAATNVHESFFFRTTMKDELSKMKCIYNVDGESFQACKGTFNNGLYHFDLDVASLRDGLHRITYLLTDEVGTTTKMNTAFFIKTPVGGNGIASYKYWLNDNEDKATFVKLKESKDPFQLISLLPVETCPIRSSCFHFEIEKDGTPMMYAKNDIRFQFFDVTGHMLDAQKQFVDYNVSEPIQELTPLVSNQRVYKVKPVNSKIHWFTMQAAQGDSLSVKADQACTMQMFSPSGKEVFRTDGVGCMNYDGCHATENGTYYLAVHDATGERDKNIAIDYQHIDKYDVLRQDVKVVGNGGYTTITYEGNGFDNLYAVDYVNANNDTIHCESVQHISDAEVAATADFNGAAIAQYDAIFHFTGEDRVVEKGVKVEGAKDIHISVRERHSNLFLRGTNTKFTFTLTNNGNMTAYRVPLYLYIASENETGVKRIDLNGFGLPDLFEGVNRDSLDNTTLAELERLKKEMDDSHYFISVKGYNEDVNDTVAVRSGYFFTDIAPNTSKTVEVNVTADEDVHVWMTAASDILPWTSKQSPVTFRSTRGQIRENYCCLRERIQCVVSVLNTGLDIAGEITSTLKLPQSVGINAAACVTSALSEMEGVIGDTYCVEDGPSDEFEERRNKFFHGMSITGILGNCLQRLVPKWEFLANFNEAIGNINDKIDLITWYECAEAFTEKKPGCPSDPPHGGKSKSVNSFDPNDILGYVAESGSHAVKRDQKELFYTIEFENDTAFATSNALQVRIENKLDRQLFDMKSFKPTELKIGNKTVALEGKQNFVTTVDMRPEIYAIAQVECKFDANTGVSNWLFTSLDPMTMEPTNEPMDGFLPVNNSDGDGQGEVTFTINLLKDFEDGTVIPNQASIIFDKNEPIVTPVWTNTIDTVAPASRIVKSELKNDTTLTLHFNGKDNRSGVWRYNLYVQMGNPTDWVKVEENITDSIYDYHIFGGMDYGFYVTATDSAGNVELKVPAREISHASYILGDANGDKVVDGEDRYLATQKYLGKEVFINMNATDVVKDGVIDGEDLYGITKIYLNSSKKKVNRMRKFCISNKIK